MSHLTVKLLIAILATIVSTVQAGPADHVFLNGSVYTVNAAQPWSTALAVHGSEIAFVGDDEEARKHIGKDTIVTDLEGKMLLPGFQDSHLHLLWGGLVIAACNLGEAGDPQQVKDTLLACAGQSEGGDDGWLKATLWERESFPEGIPPKGFLDELFPSRPVTVESSDGHSQWVNKPALARAGISNNTLNPHNGVIVRDADTGEATGMISGSAMSLIDAVLPPTSAEQNRSAIFNAMKIAHSFGITSAIDPGMDHGQASAYTDLARDGKWAMRTLLAVAPTSWSVGSFGDEIYGFLKQRGTDEFEIIKSNSVKMFIDGAVEGATAALMEPYLGEFEHHVQPYYDITTLSRYFIFMDSNNINIHVHAIGDAGIRAVLDAFEGMRAANGPSDNRHVMTHLQLVDPDDIGRFAALDITASFSALWAYPDEYALEIYPPMIGQKRSVGSYPVGSIHRTGARIAGASDWTVTSMDPLQAIETAITRQDPDTNTGAVLDENERVDLKTMIEAYTINTAWLLQNEKITGSLEVGKKADLVVLDRNLFEIPVYEINEARVVMTMFDGKVVYQRAP